MAPPKDPVKYKVYIERQSESHKGKHPSKETREKMGAAHKGLKCPPRTDEWKERQRQSHLGKNCGKDNGFFGKKHSDLTKERIRMKRIGKPSWNSGKINVYSEEVLEKMRISQKKWKRSSPSDETRERIRKTKIGIKRPDISGSNSPMWKGGISFEPYCPKFTKEFKERVRAFFNYTCIECGTPQNGTKHCVHHVNFNKETCCDDTIPLFVPLCKSCHNKTNFDREYWKNYFINIISNYYGGKCFFTNNEMNKFLNSRMIEGIVKEM